MANYDFNKDLKLGHRGENLILEDLKKLGATLISKNDTNSHDLLVNFNGQKLRIECKTDVYKNTGNYFVETKCRGKDSGITVTQSDIFVTYFLNTSEIWYIKTNSLKSIIKKYPHKKIYMGGDKNSNTEGLLIRKDKYKNHFTVRKIDPSMMNSF